jgi:hypothetical protein
MTTQSNPSVSRRTALAGLGAGSLGLALAAASRPAAAQDTSTAMAKHPIVGVWLVTTPIGPSFAVFSADGVNIQGVPTAQAGPQGVTFTGAQIGTWEPISDRGVHFTGVQLQTDASGKYLGSVTIDGHPVVSADGQTITDQSPATTITVRDATGTVVNVIKPNPGSPPATGVRLKPGFAGFPAGTPAAGTPPS